MRSVRKNVFETNSSSTHSLTLKLLDRKYTQKDKLESNKVYFHKLMGEKKNSSEGIKCCEYTYSSEYEKLCVLFDMLFMYYFTHFFTLRDDTVYLEQYRKKKSDTNEVLYLRMVLEKLLGSYDYLAFLKPLKRRNIVFKVDKDEYSKSDTEYLYFDFSGYFFDFFEYIQMLGFRTIAEAIEDIVFNPKYAFVIYIYSHY